MSFISDPEAHVILVKVRETNSMELKKLKGLSIYEKHSREFTEVKKELSSQISGKNEFGDLKSMDS